jgi:predicted unusual protein kinase regulating ubiquinone biosynthesis (AarF/ABC1/UbiB family)
MKRNEKTLHRLSTGLRRRSIGAVKIAAKTSVAMLRSSDSEQSDLRWDQVSSELGRMKGLMMKIGQMASYIEGSLPPEARPFLSKLQHQSEPLSFEAVAAVVEAELGAPIDALFDSFEPEALAAASIGQVHRAVIGGKTVAVKVQYPEIRQALSDDLKAAGRLTRLGMLIAPGGGKDLVQEMKDRFLEECDYAQEANYLRTFQHLVAPIEGASVPGVVATHSGSTVLTMDFIEGMPFDEFRAQASQAEKDRAAQILARFIWNNIFRHGIFNADPHPGNYVFQATGEVTFLDFGCVKQFDAERMGLWKQFARAILEGDHEGFKQSSIAMGLVGRERSFPWDAHWELLQYLYRPFLEDDFEYTQEYVQEVYNVFKQNVDLRRTKLPGDMLFTNRLQFGFNSILSQLGGRANWKQIFREAVYAELEPVTVVKQPARPPA